MATGCSSQAAFARSRLRKARGGARACGHPNHAVQRRRSSRCSRPQQRTSLRCCGYLSETLSRMILRDTRIAIAALGDFGALASSDGRRQSRSPIRAAARCAGSAGFSYLRRPQAFRTGQARGVRWSASHGHRRSVHRDEGTDRRLLALGSEGHGRGGRLGQALPRSDSGPGVETNRLGRSLGPVGCCDAPGRGYPPVEQRAAPRARARLNDQLDPRVAVGTHGSWQACTEIGAPGYGSARRVPTSTCSSMPPRSIRSAARLRTAVICAKFDRSHSSGQRS